MAKAKISKKVKLAHVDDMYNLLERLSGNTDGADIGEYLETVEDVIADVWRLIKTMQEETKA